MLAQLSPVKPFVRSTAEVSMNKGRLAFFLALAAICVGCRNPYTDFYQARQQVVGNEKFVQPQGEPSIYSYSGNIDQDNRVMRENGFDLVGYSSFTGGGQGATNENLLTQARTIGASVVMRKAESAGTVSGVMPYTTTSPGQIITSNNSGTANAYGTGGSAYGSYQGTTTTNVPGTTSTQMVPYTIQRYSFFATYWAKFRVVHCGAFYVNLPPAMSQQLQRNTGVVIDLIIKGSPAFFANVLVGDAVIKVNEDDVVDVPGFQNILMRNAGNQVTLTILRGKEQKQISLKLN